MAWKPDYTTVEDAADFVRAVPVVDDAWLALWVTSASRAIDRRCNRQFGQVAAAVERTYRTPAAYDRSTGLWLVEVDDVQDTTGMTVGGVALASSGATLLPDNAAEDGKPYTRLGFDSCPDVPLVASALWGWSDIPTQVVGACLLQVSRFHARRDSPYGVTGSPQQGGELRLLARLDPDVAVSLTGLSRPRRAR